MNQDFKELITNKLITNTKKQDKCLIWTGPFQKYKNAPPRCTITTYHENGARKVYSVHFLVWNLHQNSPDNFIKQTDFCVRICENNACVEINHLQVKSRTELTKQGRWELLLQNSERQPKSDGQEIGCLYWNKVLTSGYGQTTIQDESYAVHRVSYWIHNKDIEKLKDMPKKEDTKQYMVCHKCNNKKCFEPTHLYLGTNSDNAYDVIKSRIVKGELRAKNSSIDEKTARLIKLSKYPTNYKRYKTQKERAEQFGVKKSLVSDIDCNRSWAHLPDRTGKISTTTIINTKAQECVELAKKKIWTNEMFETAKKKLFDNSTLSKDKSPHVESHCRLWNGALSNAGYGETTIFGKDIATHILAAEININKNRSKGVIALHLCDVKSCCNPEHLTFGTAVQNSADALNHGLLNTKVTVQQVKEIRDTYGKDNLTTQQRADKYGIKNESLRDIELRNSWKCVK